MEQTFEPFTISRPDRSLLKYYFFCALLAGPAFPIAFLPLYFKYETLKYRFDAEGIFMSWGILWRREVLLTYRRIQDIHLTRNLIQRWMGLATVSIQTAAGSALPEMSLEGILEATELRDFLYARMRGGLASAVCPPPPPPPTTTQGQETAQTQALAPDAADEALTLLREIRDELRIVASRKGGAA